MGDKECGKSTFVRGLIGKEECLNPDEAGDEAMTVRALTLPNSSKHIYLVVCFCLG